MEFSTRPSKWSGVEDGVRKIRFKFATGDVVKMTFSVTVKKTLGFSTLLDIEDTDDVEIDGKGTGAGLRRMVD